MQFHSLRLSRFLLSCFPVFLLACFPAFARAADAPLEPSPDGVIDLPMYFDPVLEAPASARTFHPRLKLLWLQALNRPESEFRRNAADAFRTAAGMGMTGWEEVVPALVARLETDADPVVRVAAAGALAAINDPAAAPALLQAARAAQGANGHPMILTVDPALAEWAYEPAYPMWIERLSNRDALAPTRISAARALAVVKHAPAVEPLTAVALDASERTDLRLAAARALGAIAETGLADEAEGLAQGSMTDRVAAAAMLASHPAAEVQSLLLRLAADDMGPVAAAALASLNAIDPAIVAGQADRYLAHDDPLVREHAVRALAMAPSAAGARQLAARLDDPIVKVRSLARETLLDYARSHGLDSAVRQAVTPILNGSGWRGLEQAAILLGDLDHEPSADRLVALLTHDRPEVRLAAATALRELAVPATLPALLQRAEEITAQVEKMSGTADTALPQALGEETTQLFQAFGQMRYAEAEPLMRRYIPKNSGFYGSARAAAVYALGKLHEDELVDDLARQFASRLSDIDPMNPELNEVRRFAAIGLGRMKAAGQTRVLERFHQEENSSVDIGAATRWALIRITGETMPPLKSLEYREMGWFLEPN